MLTLKGFLSMLLMREFVWCYIEEYKGSKRETIARGFADEIAENLIFSNKYIVSSFSINSRRELLIIVRLKDD